MEIEDALPDGFRFYQLGRLERQPARSNLTRAEISAYLCTCSGIGFRIHSLQKERNLMMILTFEKGLDQSTYSEMGNIIASKLASAMSDMSDSWISPPQPLKAQTLEKLLSYEIPTLQRSYVHIQNELMIPVKVFVMASPSFTEEGHA